MATVNFSVSARRLRRELQELERILGWSGRKLAPVEGAAPPVRGERNVADLLLEDRDCSAISTAAPRSSAPWTRGVSHPP
jgi:hypothetical protein